MTDFDFTTLKASEATLPESSGAGRTSKYAKNPFEDTLAESWEAFENGKNAGRQVKIPGSAVGEAVYLIRKAADALGVGSRVVILDNKGKAMDRDGAKTAAKSPRAMFTVQFAAKNRRKSKNSDTAESDTAENASESDENAA